MSEKQMVALVVDDERGTRELIERVLRQNGIVPVSASDPLRALQILEDNQRFDLVVTDYQMPNLNGREFIEALKKDPKKGNVPVIMVSGVISLREISDLMGGGVEYFVPKPLNLKELTRYVELYRNRYLNTETQSASTNGN